MKFKDIVNRDNVNLKNCADEAIHIPGSIQPHGFLLAFNKSTLICEVCSENVDDFLGQDLQITLGSKCEDIFDTDLSDLFFSQSQNHSKQFTTTKITITGKDYSVSCHQTSTHLILEAEPADLPDEESVDLYQSSKILLDYIENSQGLIELADAVAVAIKNLTQYDRVMIYRFDEQYNGEIIAESKENELSSFLGLHYPHTDIPAQARALYIKNLLRIVGAVDYQPVPLYAIENCGVDSLDLSLSTLRSVSPIHLKYLKNMGVGATLTVSLLHKGKLWGLIACHHSKPKYLSQATQAAVKLHGHFITSQIDIRVQNEEYEVARQANQCVENLSAKELSLDLNSFQELFTDKDVSQLCNSIGACVLLGKDIYRHGKTPDDHTIKNLSSYLHLVSHDKEIYTDCLATIVSDMPVVSADYPGVVFYSLGNAHDCLMWFRQETIKEVTWAGEPSHSKDDKEQLSPRESFAKWTQSVSGRSRPWLTSEISATQRFASFFQTHYRSVLLNEEKETHRKLNDILKDTNSELENINWISTHDLQEPLRKIRMMTSILVEGREQSLPEAIMLKVLKIQNSAERLQNLIQSIMRYTKMSNNDKGFEQVDLNPIVADIQLELAEDLEAKGISLEVSKLPTVYGVPFLLTQVFSNLLYNSIKFSDVNKPSKISVSYSIERVNAKDYVKISVTDNGIGFDNQYNEKIFKIFSRLHSVNKYRGTGIGLALCKKILLKHNGFIDAQGVLGEGAIFSAFLPKQVQ